MLLDRMVHLGALPKFSELGHGVRVPVAYRCRPCGLAMEEVNGIRLCLGCDSPPDCLPSWWPFPEVD